MLLHQGLLHGASRIQIQPCSLKQWTMLTESSNIWYQLVPMSIEGKQVHHVRMARVTKAAPQKTESKWIKRSSLISLSRHSRYSRIYRPSKTRSRSSCVSRAINHEICHKHGCKKQAPESQTCNLINFKMTTDKLNSTSFNLTDLTKNRQLCRHERQTNWLQMNLAQTSSPTRACKHTMQPIKRLLLF